MTSLLEPRGIIKKEPPRHRKSTKPLVEFPEEVTNKFTWREKMKKVMLAMPVRGNILHEIRFPDTFNGLYSTEYSLKGDYIIAGFGAGCIQVRNAQAEIKMTIRNSRDKSYPIMCIRFNPRKQDQFFTASACGAIFMCSTSITGYIRYIEEYPNEINSFDINNCGEKIVTGGKDASVRVYDLETGKIVHTYERDKTPMNLTQTKLHRMRIYCVKFKPHNNELFVTGGWDDTVKMWDHRVSDGCVMSFIGPHICGDGIDIKDHMILTASWRVNEGLQLWDLNEAKLLDTIVPINRTGGLDGEYLYEAKFFNEELYDDLIAVCGSGVSHLEVIKLSTKEVVGNFRSDQAMYTLSCHKNKIVYGGKDTFIRVAEFD